MTLYVHNPTPHARTEWVLFGLHDNAAEAGTIVHRFVANRSSLCAAKVKVPANFTGAVDPLPDNDPPGFVYHPLVIEHFGRGLFRPWVEFHDERAYFVPDETCAHSDRCIVVRWTAATRYGVAHLYTYAFHRQSSLRIRLAVYCQSLDRAVRYSDVQFGGCGAGALTVLYHPPELPEVEEDGTTYMLIDTDHYMGDGQGRRWEGVVLLGQQDPQTIAAQNAYPLYALAEWPAWGNFDAAPIKLDAVAFPYGVEWSRLWDHFGILLAKQPGRTGDQAAFGTWSLLEQVGTYDPRFCAVQNWAVAQTACRPTHFFEPNGTMFQAAKHPDCVMWSEQPHWSSVVSPDRLGRTHSFGMANGWLGRDDEHRGEADEVAGQVLLHADFAARDELRWMMEAMLSGWTLPSQKPGWSTNAPNSGRGIARTMYAVESIRRVLGDEATPLVEHLAQRWGEVENNHIHEKGDLFWYESDMDQRHTLPLVPPHYARIPWQDGLWWGLVPILSISEIEDLARSVVLYGYSDQITGSWDIAEAIDETAPVPPPWTDRSMVKPTVDADFRHWCLPLVTLLRRYLEENEADLGPDAPLGAPETVAELIDRCRAIEAALWPTQDPRYRGV